MADFMAVSDVDLARARRDYAYRQQLLTSTLERLLAELNRHKQKATGDPNLARQLREGSLLAVKLADLIARLEASRR